MLLDRRELITGTVAQLLGDELASTNQRLGVPPDVHAGFSRVVEVVGQHRPGVRHPLYESGQRRCFVALK